MCVITVSGGWYRGGQMFAEGLARRLGYRCINRDVIIEAAAGAGAREKELREALLKPPSLLDRFITHQKYTYLTQLQAALAEEVEDGDVVYHGYAGHLLLSDAGPVLRIRVIGDWDTRIGMLEEELGLSRERAEAQAHRSDAQRKKWTSYLYGVDWEDPSLYDMVLNLGHLMQIADACDMVATAVRQQSCFEATEERMSMLKDFALASHVRAALATLAPTTNHHINRVAAHDGTVRIEGALDEAEQITDIENIAAAVPGVKGVDLRY